jgi:hypothetical protein
VAIDVAVHKKQYELLPPEKKARLMETRAEQHHDYLIEEDKKISAQIRSVAATLYEKVDLDKLTVEFLREHFYKDPTLALAYFSCCSTDPRVAIFNDELQPDVDGSVIWNHISNLIRNPIEQEEAMLCQETFNNLDQSHARIAACASCCERRLSADGQQAIVEMKIDDLPSEFLITELQKECLTTLPQYNVQKSYSSSESQWNFPSFESRFGNRCKSNSALSCMCRKSNDLRSKEYCSRQQLWLTWQFETTEWYNLECMCTYWIIQH